MAADCYSYRTLPSHLRDWGKWPIADISTFSDDVQSRYFRLMRGIKLYLQSGKLKKAAKEADCSASVLLKQLNRCVSPCEAGKVIGWAALVPHTRVGRYERKAPVQVESDVVGAKPTGMSGAFEQFLLTHKELEEVLHEIIRNGGRRGAVAGGAPSKKAVFKAFKSYCLQKGGMQLSQYPWCGKTCGRRSIERYIDRRIECDKKTAETWLGRDAIDVASLGNGLEKFDLFSAPMDLAQFDAHKLDCVGVVIMPGPAGPQPVPISRLWVCAFDDVCSRAICGVSVGISPEIDADDVVRAARTMVTKWEPKILPAGLRYLPGACLPAGNVNGLKECRPCAIQFDNASPHYANKIQHSLRRSMGCIIRYNPVRTWWANAIIERLFNTLENYGFQRLPSAIGAKTSEQSKNNPVKAAQHNGITWQDLVALVEVLAANYNATDSQAIGNQSPIKLLEWRLSMESDEFIPRLAPPVSATSPPVGIVEELVRVGGSSERGKLRSPYVEIDKVRHACPELKLRRDLIGQRIIAHIDVDDMRVVKLFAPNGRFIGDAIPVIPGWRKTKHTRQMRKAINRLIDIGVIKPTADDVVEEYVEHLARGVAEEASRRRSKISREATQLAEARRDADLMGQIERQPAKRPVIHVARPMPSHIPQPNWKAR